jgi:hypothetical protein
MTFDPTVKGALVGNDGTVIIAVSSPSIFLRIAEARNCPACVDAPT